MGADSTPADSAQEFGILVQQDGKPQRVLSKYLNLMLNYQYGLSVLVAQDLSRAQTFATQQGEAVRCIFIIQSQESKEKDALDSLGDRGGIPQFLILPQASSPLKNGLS